MEVTLASAGAQGTRASWLVLALALLLGGCAPRVFPDGASNEYEANRILARCETAAKPKTYYDIIPLDPIYLERPRDEYGIGIWGFSVDFPVRRDDPSRIGLRQGAAEPFSFTDTPSRRRQAFLLYTGERPEEMPAVRVHAETPGGEVVAMTRVNQCDLLHTQYVTFAGLADVQLRVRERARGDFTQTLRVSAKARRQRHGSTCGGATGAGVLLLPGQKARVASIRGGARYGTFHRELYGPSGTPNRWSSYRYGDLGHVNHGALVMQTPHSLTAVHVGDRVHAEAVTCVSFFVNDTDTGNNRGSFEVKLDVEDEG